MEETTAHESTATTDPGILSSLGLNLQLFVYQFINFILVVLVIWFLILKPLTKKMEERKNIIDESLDKAKEVESNLMMSEQKFKETLQQAKNEASGIIQKAHDEAEKMGADMKEKTKKELADLIEKAKKTMAAEKEEMKAELRQETVELVILTAEKILGEKLDDKKDEKFIRDILSSTK